MPDQLTIIIPVYNEGVNFPALWTNLCAQIRSQFIAHVVYDFPEDDTVPIVKHLIAAGERRIHLVQNQVRRGVLGAILTGFQQASSGPVLVVMGDLSDDLGQVEAMLNLYQRGYKVVVGSRYMRGGRVSGGPWFKQLLSRLAGLTLHWLRGVPTHDATNAFKIYDAEMLHSLSIESRGGFELSLEITVKAFLKGHPITEVPAHWRDRTAGKSQFRMWSWLPQYLKWYLYAFRPRKAPSV
jgi:dolichol-phosphate mannosyltransferase